MKLKEKLINYLKYNNIAPYKEEYYKLLECESNKEIKKFFAKNLGYCIGIILPFLERNPKFGKYIKDSSSAYLYCYYIEDIKTVRKQITDSSHAYWYCRDVKDRKSVRKYITSQQEIHDLNQLKLENY